MSPAPRAALRGRGAAAAVLLALAVPACARQGAPPGGPTDRRPPVVIRTVPDTFATVEAVDDPLLIRFNERISERPASGTLDQVVLVSPRTGEVRVEHRRDALEVDLSGGFRPGLVYRVTVRPVLQDMFGNTMREAFEFVFSTGAPFTPNVVAGIVLERTTGEPVEGYQVRARGTGADSIVTHVAVTDTGGFFALRYLPPGRYDLTAFQDLNRNQVVDFAEARGTRGLLFREADTVVVEVPVLRPDTSRAVLGRAVPETPTALRLEFDDYLEPDASPRSVAVALELDTVAPAGAPEPPAVEGVLHPPGWRARLDSAAAAEGGGAPPGTPRRLARPGEVPTTPGQQRGRVAGAELPSRELFVLLEDTLPANVPYRVTVTGVVNINGVPFGGGSAVVVRQPPPADTTRGTPADTSAPAGAAPDTAAIPAGADTTGARPGAASDTARVPSAAAPDTGGVPADTTGAAADTVLAPTDTVAPGRRRAARPPGSVTTTRGPVAVRGRGRGHRSARPPRPAVRGRPTGPRRG